ncbi:LuxR C-terminal-related transcriptional regulator [Acrocarpospora sp. B8E8]|uniref:helix-turn-helix transcriptional regulator n=1 Tax=Acrocarpospora sp. B8E8 TaxID=3153572 RepID=UPI00325C9602
MDVWPFVGRRAEREWAVATLRRGNVVIAGAAGVGKSRLASEVATAFEATVHVRGTRAARALPLGAFAPLLPEGEPGFNPLRWAAGAILSRAPSLLVVDDAHLLDASSAALTHQLADAVRVLATVRAGEECPDSVTALWEDDLGSRLDLAPLTDAETAVVLASVLGDQVDPPAAARLHTLSQGNVLLLRELVTAALEGQVLVRPDGLTWRLEGEVPRAPRLMEMIERRMGRFGDAVTSVLELVALAEPIGLAPLAALTGGDAVEEAESRGLVDVVSDGRRAAVRLAHPLYGEAVRLPVTRRRRRYGELADALQATGARRREDVLRIAVWRLESGTTPDPAPLVRACRLAWASHDFPLAIRLARAALARAGTDEDRVDAAIMLGTLLNYSSQPAEAETLIAQLPAVAVDERRRTELALTRAWSLALGLGRVEEGMELLSRTREQITQVAFRQDLSTLLIMIMSAHTGFEELLRHINALLAEPPVTAAVRAQALNCRALTLATIGRYHEAEADIAAAVGDHANWVDAVPVILLPLHANWSLNRMMLGDVDGMEAAMDNLAGLVGSGHGFSYAAQALALHRAMAARMRGRFTQAARLLQDARRFPGDDALTGLLVIEHAYVLALRGDGPAARATFDEGVTAYTRLGGLVDMFRYLTEPWVIAASGELRKGVEFALVTADVGRGMGAVAFETHALHTVARLGFAERAADRLAELASAQDGDLASLFAVQARASAVHDAPALERVTSEFTRLGLLPYAAEACAQAAQAWEHAGRHASGRAAASRAWLLAARCDGLRTPAVAHLTAPGLTRREAEIARLACTGLPSKQIAERLFLSPRTVDNHLQNVYAKLGVSNRSDLRRVLRPD